MGNIIIIIKEKITILCYIYAENAFVNVSVIDLTIKIKLQATNGFGGTNNTDYKLQDNHLEPPFNAYIQWAWSALPFSVL